MHRLGSFLRSFGVSREPLLEPGGTHPGLSWVTLPLLGGLLDPCLASWTPSWEPLGTHLMFSWVTLCLLGSLVT